MKSEMLKPEEIPIERERIRAAVSEARAKVEEAMDSGVWAYTMEVQLRKLDTAKKILEEVERDIASTTNPAEPIAPVKPSQIIEAVASFYKFTPPTLTGRSGKKTIVEARQVAMYLIRQETDCTLAEIGKELGGRCPATILAAYMKIANHLNHDVGLRTAIRSIQKKLLERVSV